MRLRRIKNDNGLFGETNASLTPAEEWPSAEYEPDYQPNGGGRKSLLELIRRKRNLIDNCFEDENYGVEPC